MPQKQFEKREKTRTKAGHTGAKYLNWISCSLSDITGFTEEIIKAAIAARQVIIWLPKATAHCKTEA